MRKENLKIIKGRDYFDLLWFLERKTVPNLLRLNDLLHSSYSLKQLIPLIDQKVKGALTVSRQYFKQDLLAFIDNPQLLDGYMENYRENYDNAKKYLIGKN